VHARSSDPPANGSLDPLAVIALIGAVIPCCPIPNLVGAVLGGWRWRVAARTGHPWSRRLSIAATIGGMVCAGGNVWLASSLEARLLASVAPVAAEAVTIAAGTDPIRAVLEAEVGVPVRLSAQTTELSGSGGWLLKFSSRWRAEGPNGACQLECLGNFVPSTQQLLPLPVVATVRVQDSSGDIEEWNAPN